MKKKSVAHHNHQNHKNLRMCSRVRKKIYFMRFIHLKCVQTYRNFRSWLGQGNSHRSLLDRPVVKHKVMICTLHELRLVYQILSLNQHHQNAGLVSFPIEKKWCSKFFKLEIFSSGQKKTNSIKKGSMDFFVYPFCIHTQPRIKCRYGTKWLGYKRSDPI